MWLFREFGYPIAAMVIEVLIRALLLNTVSWTYVVNPGTVTITFAVWASLASLRTPSRSAIPTDEEFDDALDGVRTVLSFLAMLGFMLFGGSAIVEPLSIVLEETHKDIAAHYRTVFVTLAALYGIASFILIVANAKRVRSLFLV